MWNRTVVLFLKHPLPLFVRGGIFQRLIIVQPVVTTMNTDRIDAIFIQLGVLILIITIASVVEILALILFVGVLAIVLILAALFLVEV